MRLMDKAQGREPIASLETLRGLLLKSAQESSVDAVLRTVVQSLAELAEAAVAGGEASETLQSLKRRLETECGDSQEAVPQLPSFGEIIGQSAAVRSLAEQIELVAPTDASVSE